MASHFVNPFHSRTPIGRSNFFAPHARNLAGLMTANFANRDVAAGQAGAMEKNAALASKAETEEMLALMKYGAGRNYAEGAGAAYERADATRKRPLALSFDQPRSDPNLGFKVLDDSFIGESISQAANQIVPPGQQARERAAALLEAFNRRKISGEQFESELYALYREFPELSRSWMDENAAGGNIRAPHLTGEPDFDTFWGTGRPLDSPPDAVREAYLAQARPNFDLTEEEFNNLIASSNPGEQPMGMGLNPDLGAFASAPGLARDYPEIDIGEGPPGPLSERAKFMLNAEQTELALRAGGGNAQAIANAMGLYQGQGNKRDFRSGDMDPTQWFQLGRKPVVDIQDGLQINPSDPNVAPIVTAPGQAGIDLEVAKTGYEDARALEVPRLAQSEVDLETSKRLQEEAKTGQVNPLAEALIRQRDAAARSSTATAAAKEAEIELKLAQAEHELSKAETEAEKRYWLDSLNQAKIDLSEARTRLTDARTGNVGKNRGIEVFGPDGNIIAKIGGNMGPTPTTRTREQKTLVENQRTRGMIAVAREVGADNLNYGISGKIRGTVQDLIEQGDALGTTLGDFGRDIQQTIKVTKSDVSLTEFNTDLIAIQMLSHFIAFRIVEMTQPGSRVSNQDYAKAVERVGTKGPLANKKRFFASLDTLERLLDVSDKTSKKLLRGEMSLEENGVRAPADNQGQTGAGLNSVEGSEYVEILQDAHEAGRISDDELMEKMSELYRQFPGLR